jgi:hypothetical protein
MDCGGLGNGTVADVEVGKPSIPPVQTRAGQNGVVAGAGKKAGAARLFFLLLLSWVSVTTSNTHPVMVSGTCVIVLIQAPSLTVTWG